MVLRALMRDSIYSRSPRNLIAGVMGSVVFELGLGDCTGTCIPAREQRAVGLFGWKMTKNGGSKF